MLRIILNQEFRGAKDVGLGVQNTTGSGIPSPGYAYIQGSKIGQALSGLTRLPQA